MPITQLTPQSVVDDMIRRDIEKKTRRIISSMQRAGEDAVTAARRSHQYRDQTGNLTSSIGYVVVYDGQVVTSSGFEVVKQGEQGAKEGKQYLEQLIASVGNATALIVVAGMDYACYVEDMGLDVLSSAKLVSVSTLTSMLKKHGLMK